MNLSPDLTATVHRIASNATRTRPDLHDDAVQEGLTAAWLLPDDASTGLAVRVAQRAILNLLAGRPSVVSRGGRRRYAPSSAYSLDEAPPGAESEDRVPVLLRVAGHEDDVVTRLDLDAAIATLHPEDARLVRRTLDTGSISRAADELGIRRNTARARWSRVLRPRLAAALFAA